MPRPPKCPPPLRTGFTLIELMIVMAILAILLTIAVPRYFSSIDNSKETALRQSLSVMREAIDHHFADTGKYPPTIEALAEARYLRAIPVDPITERSDTWRGEPPRDPKLSGVGNVRSGAEGNGHDGTAYSTW